MSVPDEAIDAAVLRLVDDPARDTVQMWRRIGDAYRPR
jgi:hypothetical protein